MTKLMIKLLKPQKVNWSKILTSSVHLFLSNLIYIAIKRMSNLIPKMSNLILSLSKDNREEANPFWLSHCHPKPQGGEQC